MAVEFISILRDIRDVKYPQINAWYTQIGIWYNAIFPHATNIDTVATNITNVNTTATNIANVNAVASDLLEPVSEINTVATNIGAVEDVAGWINTGIPIIGSSESVVFIGTIAALRLLTYAGQQIVSVTGYYSALDNIGVREYFWDALSVEADNGGTIIQVTGVVTGRWKMKYSGAVNVKWFGAKGDGVTDDTLAIQKACNFSSTIISDTYFQDGNYRVTETIYIQQSLIGMLQGRKNVPSTYPSTIIADNIVAFTVFKSIDLTGEGNHRLPSIKNLSANSNQSKIHTFVSGESYLSNYENLSIFNFKTAFKICGVSTVFSGLYCMYNGVGLQLLQLNNTTPSTDWSIKNSTFHTNDNGIEYSAKYFTDAGYENTTQGSFLYHRNSMLQNVTCERNTNDGIRTIDNAIIYPATLENCWLEQNTGYGINSKGSGSILHTTNTRLEFETINVDLNSSNGGKLVDSYLGKVTSQQERSYLRGDVYPKLQTLDLMYKLKYVGETTTYSYIFYSSFQALDDIALTYFGSLAIETDLSLTFTLNAAPLDGKPYILERAAANVVGIIRASVGEIKNTTIKYNNTIDGELSLQNYCRWNQIKLAFSNGTANIRPDWVQITIRFDPQQTFITNGLTEV